MCTRIAICVAEVPALFVLFEAGPMRWNVRDCSLCRLRLCRGAGCQQHAEAEARAVNPL